MLIDTYGFLKPIRDSLGPSSGNSFEDWAISRLKREYCDILMELEKTADADLIKLKVKAIQTRKLIDKIKEDAKKFAKDGEED